jgi:hypothetical protein
MRAFSRQTAITTLKLSLLLLLLLPQVSADVAIPTKTTILIDQDGQPFTGPVSFNVSCYGYMCRDYACRPDPAWSERDPHNAALVFSYSASCPQSGCVIYQPFYTNHRHIAWCDMAGTAGGTPFSIPNFSESPVPDCRIESPFDVSENGTFYRYSPEYRTCMKQNEQEKKEICGEYIVPITWAEIERSTGLSWFANNGTYYIRTDAYFVCISQMEKESRGCGTDHPLEPVDTALIDKDPNGNFIANYCTLRIPLPDTIRDTSVAEPPDTRDMPTPPEYYPAIMSEEPAAATTQQASPVESLYCSLLSLFGAKC